MSAFGANQHEIAIATEIEQCHRARAARFCADGRQEKQMVFVIAGAETARKPPPRKRDEDPIEAHSDVHEEPGAGTAARECAGRAVVPVHATPPIVPRRYGGTRVFASLLCLIGMG